MASESARTRLLWGKQDKTQGAYWVWYFPCFNTPEVCISVSLVYFSGTVSEIDPSHWQSRLQCYNSHITNNTSTGFVRTYTVNYVSVKLCSHSLFTQWTFTVGHVVIERHFHFTFSCWWRMPDWQPWRWRAWFSKLEMAVGCLIPLTLKVSP